MRRSFLIEIGVAAAVIACAAVFGSFAESGALRDGLIRLCCLGLFAVSLNLLVGYTGLLSFGHALFYGLGAYAFCLLMQTGTVGIPVAALASLVIAAIMATLIGLICIRLTHVYFAFLTLAIQMLFYSVLIAWSGLTGGEQGLIGGIPKPPFLGIDLGDPRQYFLFNVVVFVASLLILRRIVTSPFGAALRMIRDNPQRAVFLGVDVPRTKLAAFVIASVFSAVAGILMGLYVSGAYPNFAYWTTSGEGLFMIMLGGINVFLGPVVGAGLLLVLETVVNAYTSHHGIIIGIAILISALGLRKGILDFVSDAWMRRREGQAAPTAAKTSLPMEGSTAVAADRRSVLEGRV
ncbi:branched-chain amino acid ABC transporter permease [Pseudorhodoplanes sp.]|uniref:branched-chain amino acid ABC transporter permease n=1 Tax=Pseudorhodoplanes sp. TaxID=1934341 RepID=UPI003D0FC73B